MTEASFYTAKVTSESDSVNLFWHGVKPQVNLN